VEQDGILLIRSQALSSPRTGLQAGKGHLWPRVRHPRQARRTPARPVAVNTFPPPSVLGSATISSEVSPISGISKDVRYAIRVLVRNPGFTAVALLTLTLGIGANSAIFTVVNTVLLRPLRFPQPDRLLMIREVDNRRGARQITLSTRDFLAYRDNQQAFEQIGAYSGGGANLNAGDHPVAVRSATISAGLFDALSVAPFMGRAFLPEEERAGRNQVAIVSYGLWKSYFGSDPNIVGSSALIDGKGHTIVGVMPADFEFPIWSRRAEIWLPLDVDTTMAKLPDAHFLSVVGRLKPGVSPDSARADMETIADRLQGITLVRGRSFNQFDGEHTQSVAIIDETMASQFFEGEDPIGARINAVGTPLTIVGVVNNVKQHGLDAADMPPIRLRSQQSR